MKIYDETVNPVETISATTFLKKLYQYHQFPLLTLWVHLYFLLMNFRENLEYISYQRHPWNTDVFVFSVYETYRTGHKYGWIRLAQTYQQPTCYYSVWCPFETENPKTSVSCENYTCRTFKSTQFSDLFVKIQYNIKNKWAKICSFLSLWNNFWAMKLVWYGYSQFLSMAGKVENVAHDIIFSIISINVICWMNNEVWNHQIVLHIGLYLHYLLQKLGAQHVPE